MIQVIFVVLPAVPAVGRLCVAFVFCVCWLFLVLEESCELDFFLATNIVFSGRRTTVPGRRVQKAGCPCPTGGSRMKIL